MFENREFRNCMGEFATGVCVVTAKNKNGTLYGVTINSFSSVSLEPPLVLYCIDKHADNYENIVNFESFNIHILSENQQDISNSFAKPANVQWGDVSYEIDDNGNPIISNCNAFIKCKKYDTLDGGDHTVILGEVMSFNVESEGKPLIYYKGKYTKVIK